LGPGKVNLHAELTNSLGMAVRYAAHAKKCEVSTTVVIASGPSVAPS
jgi:hypothetical protein